MGSFGFNPSKVTYLNLSPRTIGGDLMCKWVVHAVGPNYNDLQREGTLLEEGDRLLRSAYLATMRRSAEASAETVGFSLLSAGIFRGRRPLEDVLEIGISAAREGPPMEQEPPTPTP